MSREPSNAENSNRFSDSTLSREDIAGDEEWLDACVQKAMRAIPVPSELESKLTASLKDASLQSCVDRVCDEGDIDASPSWPEEPDVAPDLVSPSTKNDLQVTDRGWRWVSRRTQWLTSGLLTASCVLIAVAIGWTQTASDPSDLANHAIFEVEQTEQWHSTQELPPTTLAFIAQNLQSSQVVGLEEATIDAATFGQRCTVWKLTGAESDVYVCAIDAPTRVHQLSEQLQVIRDSGNWSVAAKYSHNNQIFLVITRGDVRRYFRPNRYA